MQRVWLLFLPAILLSITSGAQNNALGKPAIKSSQDCKKCPEMIVVPAGHVVMGSPASEPGRMESEGPNKSISIPSFAVGKYPVTRAQWKYFVAETHRPDHGGCAWSGLPGDGKPWHLNPAASWDKLGFTQDDDHPVVCITWQDVQDYLQWISSKTGKTYRLLSESEWEYASRAGAQTAFPWGDSASHDHANYGADSGWVGIAAGKDRWVSTSPVNAFPPNSFGLFDMSGNVNVYLSDYFSASYSDFPDNGAPYQQDTVLSLTGDFAKMSGTRTSMYRMIRGGTFGDPPVMIRSAYRNWTPGPGASLMTYASGGLGVRVAYSLK